MPPLLNQIQTPLKLPMLWRFVGFASALVGLLCFALNSSFNSVFGEWNFLKTFLYVTFSSIICTAVLFAKTWQRSSSLRFKAHMAFLVLTITSFYSSFFDKHANGKPDAYSLVSCAAFAVMSLSLSRQTHYGIEVDLLYFFLGALIIQLTKIKWLLGIVGAGFSYSLIILRSYLDALPEANGYIGLQDQPHLVIQVGSQELRSSSSGASALAVTSQEGNTQDHAVTEVDNSHSQQASADIALIKPQLMACIKELEKKNSTLMRLIYDIEIAEPFWPDHNLFIDAIPLEIINSLNETMKLAVAAGFEEECCHLYSSCRKDFLRQCLSVLNLQDFFSNEYDNVAKTRASIHSWIRATKIAVRVLFPNERRLCDRVFVGISSAMDRSFIQICWEPTIRLLNFAKTLSTEISWPEICIEVVQVFRTLPDIIPELESLFPDHDGVSLCNEAITTRKRLGEVIKDVFKDLENLIRCDTKMANVPGGIYPISCDIMNGFSRVVEVRPIIEKVLEEYSMVSNRGEASPSFLVQMAWIMELLESHLEARSKSYMEAGLGHVAIMNNSMYIKQKIRHLSGMALLVDEDNEKLFKLDPISRYHQIQVHASKIQQNLERLWKKLLE